MASKDDDEKKGGCFSKLLGLLIFLVFAGLGVAFYFISQPQDLSDIGGYNELAAVPASPPRDLKTVLQKSIEGGYSVTISEKEINEMLARELKIKQGGQLAEWVSIKSVLVRLKEDIAEVVVVRDVEGYPLTTSMFLQVEQIESKDGITTKIHLHGGGFNEMLPVPTRGGRFGQLTVPQGFLVLLMPDFEKIAGVFDDEIELGFERMARIKILNKRLMLDPIGLTKDAESGNTSF